MAYEAADRVLNHFRPSRRSSFKQRLSMREINFRFV
jgi:hypothetical protein